jgi:5-methylcytosine-specific restriction endonuclease McrA
MVGKQGGQIAMIDGKVCSDCKVYKPYSEYQRNKNNKDGYKFRCKPCQRAYDRAHLTEEAAEKKRQTAREWNKVNSDRIAADPRYQESRRRSRHRHYHKNQAKENQRAVRWMRKNPAQTAAIGHRRRVLARAAGSFTQAEWDTVIAHYGRRCLRCNATERITIDHIIPLSKGGSNTVDNLQPLCHSCNSSKGSKHIDYR